MRSEPHIPLFLWVATALVAHALGGGGATKVAEQIEETMDIGEFASQVRAQAKFAGPIEVTFEEAPEDELEDEQESEGDDSAPLDDSEEADPTEEKQEDNESEAETDEDVEAEPELVEEEKDLPEEKKEEEKKLEDKPPEEKAEQKKKPELFLNKPKPKPKLMPNRRVAVEQHVEDKNQKNPDAEFAAEHANRVEEQTQARITSTDQNAKDPTAGQNHASEDPEPGNSDETEVAQSDENEAADDAKLGEMQRTAPPVPVSRKAAPNKIAGYQAPLEKTPTEQKAQAAREAKAASEAQDGMAETHTHKDGTWSIAKAQEARAAQKAQKARQALRRIIAQQNKRKKNQPLFGYGSNAANERGFRPNLSAEDAHAVIGHDQLDNLKEQVGKRRLSKHRGSWKNLGLERWKGALENYVASVKPGNQTALNTARVPFARYLNQIHQRIHQVFAHGFLGHLEQLPSDHPLNNQEMSTHVEIALSREDGRVVRMGITKSSGVTAFDVGALESVQKAAPYGAPPGSIVSSDGNVYLHWEFHRNRMYACSTYFARPYIIDVGQKPAPPRVEPPRKPNEQENKKPDERSGSLEPSQPRKTPKRESGRAG